ncbi:membrane protein [Oceanicola granulosus HTCC2516]|uniref:Probable membrane transporter protein n=1 Tax=Oceanicola granulosus (strain ATCC BAA-861 / DSM 15982 / KCTC 12143 / HTCC2516) TaxID=314256 RepID=Q2CFX0_OCEGH|nr:sulfite exporter TauE/SafE family protein [Oceanicola granulosus]EAR51572.1 membrane protein [Oceanicola granulosus HTCC2516]
MEDMSLLLTMAALLLGIGAFAGVLAGLLGVGGGIVLVPAFFYAFATLGYDSPELMRMCLATSLATIIVTSVRSLLAHNRRGAVEWDILKGWALGIALGAVAGVAVAASLRSQTLQAIFGGLASVVGLYMLFGRPHWRVAERMPEGPVRWVLSPLIGFLSVLMGIGGGSFGVPVMSLHNVPIHRAVATAAGFGVIIAVPSVAGFLLVPMSPDVRPPLTLGAVNLVAFGLVIAMTLITAPWGAALAHRMDPGPLKRVFGAFLLLVALNMVRRALAG